MDDNPFVLPRPVKGRIGSHRFTATYRGGRVLLSGAFEFRSGPGQGGRNFLFDPTSTLNKTTQHHIQPRFPLVGRTITQGSVITRPLLGTGGAQVGVEPKPQIPFNLLLLTRVSIELTLMLRPERTRVKACSGQYISCASRLRVAERG